MEHEELGRNQNETELAPRRRRAAAVGTGTKNLLRRGRLRREYRVEQVLKRARWQGRKQGPQETAEKKC